MSLGRCMNRYTNRLLLFIGRRNWRHLVRNLVLGDRRELALDTAKVTHANHSTAHSVMWKNRSSPPSLGVINPWPLGRQNQKTVPSLVGPPMARSETDIRRLRRVESANLGGIDWLIINWLIDERTEQLHDCHRRQRRMCLRCSFCRDLSNLERYLHWIFSFYLKIGGILRK